MNPNWELLIELNSRVINIETVNFKQFEATYAISGRSQKQLV